MNKLSWNRVSVSDAARRVCLVLGLATTVAALSGCYVVPIDPRTGQAVQPSGAPVAAAPAVAVPVTLPVRLYPSNPLASGYGVIQASVTNDLQGRGTFQANIHGESFVGEATRKAGSAREGMASGAGNRGGYLSCQYTMNSATLGTGQCRLDNGAAFTMHIGH
jgi:hypothetical protein